MTPTVSKEGHSGSITFEPESRRHAGLPRVRQRKRIDRRHEKTISLTAQLHDCSAFALGNIVDLAGMSEGDEDYKSLNNRCTVALPLAFP